MGITNRLKGPVGTLGGVLEGRLRPPVVHVRPRVPGATELHGTGTRNDPFITIAAGIRAVRGGGRVKLHGGTYLESVDITGVSGTASQPIVVEPYDDKEVIIEWADEDFRGEAVPNDAWVRADGSEDFEEGAEWVSRRAFPPPGNNPDTNRHGRGSFMSFTPISGIPLHVHLVAYDRVEDLRADNEFFPDDEGHTVFRQRNGRWEENGKHPFVYMGPGIWFDTDGDRKIHIRLKHTDHGVPGGQEYHGETDPRRLRLAICDNDSHVIRLVDCHHIQFKDLRIRYGGSDTIRLRRCSDVLFDNVDVRAGSRAVLLDARGTETNERITFAHCRFDGGLPPWTFRSDRKNAYFFDDGSGGPPYAFDNLGYGTAGVLFGGTKQSLATTVHHCELVNGHDVYLFGDSMHFHHNLVDTFNDDGLALINDTTNIRIHENVVTHSHTAFSFDGERIGPVWIYRNLIDTRRPTLGNRPPRAASTDVSLRTGVFYKDGTTDGPIDFFHNTCLVRTPGMAGVDATDVMLAAYTLHRDRTPTHVRRTFNNIFVSANHDDEPKQPLAFLPEHGLGPSDGNCYFRFREDHEHTLWFWADGRTRDDLDVYQDEEDNEKSSAYADPLFVTMKPERPDPELTDDLRVQDGGGADGRGVRLDEVAPALWALDRVVTGQARSPVRPDAGCYARPTLFGTTLPLPPRSLKVGVKGRHHFP